MHSLAHPAVDLDPRRESKIHFEMRTLRSPNHQRWLCAATWCLVFAIGLALACLAAGVALGAGMLHSAMGALTLQVRTRPASVNSCSAAHTLR